MFIFAPYFKLKTTKIYTYRVYRLVEQISEEWDSFGSDIFLSLAYLKSQENALPDNMSCFYIAVYKGAEIVGKSVVQHLKLSGKEMFQFRGGGMSGLLVNLLNVNLLCLGNIKLTGEHTYALKPYNNETEFIIQLKLALKEIRQICKTEKKSVQLVLIKDFYPDKKNELSKILPKYRAFSVQPNMSLQLNKNWRNFEDYIQAMKTKYRTRTKRVFKKSEAIFFKELDLNEIKVQEEQIYSLYQNVLRNTDITPYLLPPNFFYEMKKELQENYLFFAAYEQNEIVSFYTLIRNQSNLQSGFLGYLTVKQKEKQLYARMLYEMIDYAISQGFESIEFSRTALEIKSTVGAKPHEIYGFLQHTSPFINRVLVLLFPLFYKPKNWIQRNPFKEHEQE